MTYLQIKDFQDKEIDHFLVTIDSYQASSPPSPDPPFTKTHNSLDFDSCVPLPFYAVGDNARYRVIEEELLRISLSIDLTLDNLILYIRAYTFKDMSFSALRCLLEQELDKDYSRHILTHVIPKMAELARSLHQLITKPIPLLKIGCEGSVTLSQQQIACLLANAFFCTFPEELRNDASGNSYNFINFTRLFSLRCAKSVEKLKCLLHYFSEVIKKMPCGNVTIMRSCVKQVPNWSLMTDCAIGYTKALHRGSIEKEGNNMLQVDFANKFIGGGVLSHGCVQEEIRFIICPEMLISCLISERMKSYESIRIIGAEMFSDYSGYGDTFKWLPHERDLNCPRDEYGRVFCEVVAIDALHYRSKIVQYNRGYIKREINKAYAGFSITTRQSNPDGWPIATGNWGCGAFRGDVQLKSMIQLLAASIVERKLYYFTFGDKRLAEELNEIVGILRINNISVGQLYQIIEQYAFFDARSNKPLFDCIRCKVLNNHSCNSKDKKSSDTISSQGLSTCPATSLSTKSAYDEFVAASKATTSKIPDIA